MLYPFVDSKVEGMNPGASVLHFNLKKIVLQYACVYKKAHAQTNIKCTPPRSFGFSNKSDVLGGRVDTSAVGAHKCMC